MVAAAVIGSAVVGGVASSAAGRQQANAAGRATDSQERMFNQTRDDQAPWRQAGQTALGRVTDQFGPGSYFEHQFGPEDLKSGLAPNYEFMRKQGSDAATNLANAAGGVGGNTIQAIAKWNQDYAQNAYQQAFQNYNTQRTDIFNRLASIAGLGQTASSASATGAPQFSSGIANTITGQGNANAAGLVGGANALTGGVNNYLGWQYLNRNGAGLGTPPPAGGGPV